MPEKHLFAKNGINLLQLMCDGTGISAFLGIEFCYCGRSFLRYYVLLYNFLDVNKRLS